MALIFLLSAQPGLRISDDAGVDGPVRHVAHVLAYAVLAVLLQRALATEPRRGALRVRGRSSASSTLLAVMLATLYGVTDELHQGFVPDRSGNPFDVVLDLVGAIGGVVAVWLVSRSGRRKGRSATKRG
jgi:VanZ family protein